ncbi:GDSL-type esterase/lipase family protein [Actinoallomurus purpureus]|uniref:GDSL-type esterase/lipase family protein n=1 Tax=Actinoallomurus purpureus TaxID=478114 RepID=UPI0020921BAE|nr:GDSL-type esterase/lipase family protein [Actinoallomurus purpureus]MCO6010005.1 GDSL-type esterase/lipase family protein [Actinoallomurus purpureus]
MTFAGASAHAWATTGTVRWWLVRLCGTMLLLAMTACGSAASQTRPSKSPARSFAASPQRTVRVMPLGDSITAGVNVKGGYRSDLWQLMSTGGQSVEFVGSLSAGPVQLPERRHEGHPGWEIGQLDAHVDAWLRSYRPDVVLLHIGTNDVLRNRDVEHAADRLAVLIDHITGALPNAQVYVATIAPLARAGLDARAERYNTELADVVRTRALQRRRVYLVDMHAALTRRDLAADGIHPTNGGYSKMAACWYAALRSAPMTRWEAEAVGRTSVNDGERLTDQSASGSGKVGYLNYADSHVDFSIQTPTTGWHRIYVRAANGMKGTCTQALTVNGRPQGRVDYPSYGWDHWTITAVSAWLTAGRDVLRFSHLTCAAEIDSIDVSPAVR